MKLALILGAFSCSRRPFNMSSNNLWTSKRGITGSELSFLISAQKLAKKGHDVSLFTCHESNTKPELWENVKIYHYEDRFMIDQTFDAIISWNEPDVFRGLPFNKVRICQQMFNDFVYCQSGFDDWVDIWTSPSELHRTWMLEQTPCPEKWQVNHMGTQPEWFNPQEKIKGSVAWLSSPDRGLHLLLQNWREIKKAVPEASLKIFYHINEPLEDNTEISKRIKYIRDQFIELKDLDVEYIGSISRNDIAYELSRTMIVIAPLSTISRTEGFSATAMEACMAGCVPIMGDIDCLGSIYGKVACMIPSPVEDNMEVLNASIIHGLTNENWRKLVVSRCQEFAKTYTWDAHVERLENMITNHPKYRNKSIVNHFDTLKKILAKKPNNPQLLEQINRQILNVKMSKPAISIIMPTMRIGGLDIVFNGLSKQTFKDFELIVVDGIYNYRKDLVAEKIKEYQFPVKHVAPTKNIFPVANFCNASNTGIINVASDLVLMITDYTYLPSDCLEKHVKFHRKYSEENIGYMCPHQYRLLPELHSEFFPYQQKDTDIFVFDLQFGKLKNLMWSILKKDFDQNAEELPLDSMGNCDNKLFRPYGLGDPAAFNGKNESVKLEAILKINGYDEELDGTTPYQDTEFADRLKNKLDFKWICDKDNKVYNVNPRFVTPWSRRLRDCEDNYTIWQRKKTTNYSEAINDWNLREDRNIILGK
jgi:glycosyltransferase involved in cell wall biosynthesis